MFTKEECLKALCRIQCRARPNKKCEECECFDNKVNIWKCVENTKESFIIRQLIEEHFCLLKKYKILQDENGRLTFNNIANNINDMNYKLWLENPPLKFEEMKAEDWVWDNEIRKYSKIFFVSEYQKYIVTERGYILYRANRFYRKQVTE